MKQGDIVNFSQTKGALCGFQPCENHPLAAQISQSETIAKGEKWHIPNKASVCSQLSAAKRQKL